MSSPVSTLDPHFYSTSPNNTAAFNVFDRLVHRGADGRLQPGLALSWTAVSETEWEFRLRPDVRWHDGQPLTAADVAFSLQRARNVPNNLGGFENLVRPIQRVDVVGPLVLRITTAEPVPGLPSDLSFIAVVSERIGKDATTADYNSGKAMIGTGPFRFVGYTSGDRLVLGRNEGWWGGRPEWEQVTLRMVSNIGARTASLLASDLDVIEAPSAADLPRLRQEGQVGIFAVPGSRVGYINPIYAPAADAPRITDNGGKVIEPTPLRLLKVRQALSLAINRQAITERVMMGTGSATGQWLPPGSFSALPDLGVPAYDPARAKALLAEAGFPDGFRMTLSTANDRTPYAAEITQAVAQMWSRVGVQTAVDAVPFSVYSSRGARQQFSAYFGSLNNPSLEAGLLLRNLLMTVDAAKGTGTYNWSRYSNPALDELSARAISTLDDTRREQLLRQAARQALDDVAFIPLYQFQNIWAARKGFRYEARADELTLATGIHAVPQ
jgi:peptide/nickel transport system substrate-binding protein